MSGATVEAWFDSLVWLPDRMLLDDLVFRLPPFDSGIWDGPPYFMFYKNKGLVGHYRALLAAMPGFEPKRIFELGIYDGGSTAFWYELFHPQKLAAIDIQDRSDSEYFQQYVASRGISDRIPTFWRVNQADKPRLSEICASEFVGPLDLVIDDCSHSYGPTLSSFEALFPLLAPGGLYIVEDWQWGHKPEYFETGYTYFGDQTLTELLLKIVEALGTSSLYMSAITILPGLFAITRGPGKVENPADFVLEAHIARRPPRQPAPVQYAQEEHGRLALLLRRLGGSTSPPFWASPRRIVGAIARRLRARLRPFFKRT